MSVEFVDTNVLIYARDRNAGAKHAKSEDLISRLTEVDAGAVSLQVLIEFYSAATRKLSLASQQAERIVADFGIWTIHRRDTLT